MKFDKLGVLAIAVALGTVANAQTLYTSTGGTGSRLYKIDVATQSTTLIGNIGMDRVSGLDFRSDGTLFGVSGGSAGPASLITVDINSGAGSLVGRISSVQGADGLAFDSQDRLFTGGFDGSSGRLVELDSSSGATLSNIAFVGSGNSFVAGLDFDSGDKLYGSRGNASGRTEDIVSIDMATGVLTPIGGLTHTVSGVWFDVSNTMYAITVGGDVMTVDLNSGNKTFLFNTGVTQLSGLTGVVPEPTTLIALGAALAAFLKRRKVR